MSHGTTSPVDKVVCGKEVWYPIAIPLLIAKERVSVLTFRFTRYFEIDSIKNDNAAIYGRGFFFSPQTFVNSTLFSSLLASRPVLVKHG